MTNEEKLEALKAFLSENNVNYIENHTSKYGLTMALKLPDQMIAVFLSEDGKDSEYENRIYHWRSGRNYMNNVYRVFFIREEETPEFVLEKMQNCIIDIMTRKQRKLEWEKRHEEGLKTAAENEKRHQEKLAKRAAAEAAKAKKNKRKRARIVHYEKVEPIKKKGEE